MSQTVDFTAPVIGPKVYVTKGPSGWPETFNRDKADQLLREFVGAVPLDELIDAFVAKRTLDDKAEPVSWSTVVHFLARNLSVPVKTIPDAVGIAFWAHVLTAMAAERDAAN